MTLIDKAEALAALRAAGILRDEAYDAIRTLPARVVGVQWQNINTAPRGGEWFIARTEHGTTRVVHFADEYDRFPISHDGVVWPTAPTEWMPLKPILAALAPTDAAQAREAALREAAAAWEAFKGATISDDHFAAVERLDAAFALIGERP